MAFDAHGFVDEEAEAFGEAVMALRSQKLQDVVQEFRIGVSSPSGVWLRSARYARLRSASPRRGERRREGRQFTARLLHRLILRMRALGMAVILLLFATACSTVQDGNIRQIDLQILALHSSASKLFKVHGVSAQSLEVLINVSNKTHDELSVTMVNLTSAVYDTRFQDNHGNVWRFAPHNLPVGYLSERTMRIPRGSSIVTNLYIVTGESILERIQDSVTWREAGNGATNLMAKPQLHEVIEKVQRLGVYDQKWSSAPVTEARRIHIFVEGNVVFD